MASVSLRALGSSLSRSRPTTSSSHRIRYTQTQQQPTLQQHVRCTSRSYSHYVAGISENQSCRNILLRDAIERKNIPIKVHQRQWPQQQRQFGTSSQSQPEVIIPVVDSHPRAVLSSQSLVLKQHDDDLSADELALKAAFQHHEALLDNPHAATNSEDRIKSLYSLRDALEQLEYWEDALQVEAELESYAPSALELAACIFRQGKLYVRQQNDLQGHSRYQKALEIFTIEHGDGTYHADIGNVIVAIAGVHFSQGNIDECLQTLDSAEDHFRKHGTKKSDESWFASNTTTTEPHVDLVKCLDNQGMMYRFKEDFYAALDKYEEALEVLGDRDFSKRQALQLHIAEMLKCVDDMDAAVLYYQKILQEDRERRGSDEETVLDGLVLQNLGMMHSQQRQLELAEQEMTQALEIQKRFLGDHNQEVAATLTALGSVHGVQGHKRQALECFQQALLIERIYAEDDNAPQILHILRNISVLHGQKVPKWDV